jgi:hypothetical protein
VTPPRTASAAAAAGHRAGIARPRRPAPAPDRPRHLEVVRGRPAPGRRPPRALTLAGVGVILVVVLGIVVARVLIGQAGFAESGSEDRIAQQRRTVERLELEVAQLRSPQRIYDLAVGLGLVVPDQIVFLTPSPTPSASASGSPKAPAAGSSTAPTGPGGR